MPSKKYTQAWGALYGNAQAPKPRRPFTRSNIPTEEMEQCKLVQWLHDKGILFYAIGNGRRDAAEGAKFKRLGVSAGVPDLCIPYARKSRHGLYIELKRITGGVLSDAQKSWLAFLNEQNYQAQVCRGFEHAKQTIEDYFGN